jgi:hypothetical protein
MIEILLKKWNKQWQNPKVMELIVKRVARMIELGNTVMLDTEGSDITTDQLEALLKTCHENMVKCWDFVNPPKCIGHCPKLIERINTNGFIKMVKNNHFIDRFDIP